MLGLLMFFHKVPDTEGLKNYKIALRVLSVAYLCLGAANVLHVITGGQNITEFSSLVFAGIYAIVSSLQALLFTYSLITMINTYYVTQKRVAVQLIPIVLLSVLVITGFISKNLLFLQITVFVFAACYFILLIYYTYIYASEEKIVRTNIKDFFSDDESKRVEWVRIAFYSSLTIGFWALFIILFPHFEMLEIIFSLVCLVFYPYIASRYMNYVNDFYVLQPVIIQEKTEENPPLVYSANGKAEFVPAMEKWISDKSFTKFGITINELAKQLNSNRTYLSNYFKTQLNTNFNQWLNGLRIEEAKNLLANNPELPLSEVAQQLGYKELSAFSRNFSISTGVTPSAWKKNSLNNYELKAKN